MKKLLVLASIFLTSGAFCETPVADPIVALGSNSQQEGSYRSDNMSRGWRGQDRSADMQGRDLDNEESYSQENQDGSQGNSRSREVWQNRYSNSSGSGMSGDNGYGHERHFPRYNKKTEEKIEGEIVNVTLRPIKKYSWEEVTIFVRTNRGTIPIILGPTWYVDEEGGILNPGQKIKVTGSVYTEGGHTYMIAKEVQTHHYKLELRDHNGFRLWNGWRKN